MSCSISVSTREIFPSEQDDVVVGLRPYHHLIPRLGPSHSPRRDNGWSKLRRDQVASVQHVALAVVGYDCVCRFLRNVGGGVQSVYDGR